MAKTIHNFVSESFTNEIGQTINPGDRVAYVSHCTGRVYQKTGWFDGVFKTDRGTVVLTRVRGIRTTKPEKTGKMLSYTYKAWDGKGYVDRVQEYPEYVEVVVEPHGTTVLQNHFIFKI
jgi:hypothetical protein